MTLALIVWFVLTVIPNLLILIKGILIIWAVVAGLILFWMLINYLEGGDLSDIRNIIKKSPIKSLLVLPLFLWMIIPDKNTSYAILAAYGVESIATNERVQEFGSKSLDVLEKAMEDYLKEDAPAPKEILEDKTNNKSI